MLEKLNDMPPGIEGLKAVGKLSREDYERVLEPLLEDARRAGRRVRLLYQLGSDFSGFTPGAAWEDAKLGVRYLRLFEACAIVTDVGWIREASKLARFLMPCPVQVFGNEERTKAIEWLSSVPSGPKVAHRLIADSGVIVVEVDGPLRAQDFDAVSVTADTWIESHGKLRGLVIHAREFPGWENLGGLVRHIRFVRDHHRKIERIALAADGKLVGLAPRLGEHFVAAEVKGFGFEKVDAAVAWAAGTSR